MNAGPQSPEFIAFMKSIDRKWNHQPTDEEVQWVVREGTLVDVETVNLHFGMTNKWLVARANEIRRKARESPMGPQLPA